MPVVMLPQGRAKAGDPTGLWTPLLSTCSGAGRLEHHPAIDAGPFADRLPAPGEIDALPGTQRGGGQARDVQAQRRRPREYVGGLVPAADAPAHQGRRTQARQRVGAGETVRHRSVLEPDRGADRRPR